MKSKEGHDKIEELEGGTNNLLDDRPGTEVLIDEKDGPQQTGSPINESDGDVATPDHNYIERKLLLKTDLAILPLTFILNWFVVLARSGLGNARLQGLPEDILGGDPTGSLFAWASSVFYISYILLLIPVNLLMRRCWRSV